MDRSRKPEVSSALRRRQRSAHNPRVPHLSDTVLIEAAACRALLDSGQQIDAVARLMLEVAIRHGNGVMTFGELKRAVLKEVTGTCR